MSRLRASLAAVALLAVPLAAGCATARGRADAAFARADYVAAADQYDQLAARDPGDRDLIDRRDDARTRALVVLATKVGDARRAGHREEALTALGELLARRDAWPGAAGSWTQEAIASEAREGAAYLDQKVGLLVDSGQPLGAEALIAARRPKLDFAELRPLWPALATRIQAAGQARCRAAHPDDVDATPYLARLTAEYCAHFTIDVAAPAHLPGRVSSLTSDGAISGMTPAQRDRLDATLDLWLRRSPWYEAGGAHAHVGLTGYQSATFGATDVTLDAPWTETVSYTEEESYQEPYQEEYQESYQEQVPHTVYHSESYDCGTVTDPKTCTREVSSTEYTSETRWRTAYRTAYRTAWRTVTKTREVPRVYTYDAVERTGRYQGAWAFTFDLSDAAPPLAISVGDTDEKSGYDHDASFPPAGVEPSRANLPSFGDWYEHLLARADGELPARLTAHWATSFCATPSYDPERAARCAFGAPPPAAARAELGRVFGADVDQVVARFAVAPALR
jgi:hypothetical protein